MRLIKSEKGYTLVLVLFIITLLLIFSATIMNGLLTSSKQFNKSEEEIQKDGYIRMGETFFTTAFEKASIGAKEETKHWLYTQSQTDTNPNNASIAQHFREELIKQLTEEKLIPKSNQLNIDGSTTFTIDELETIFSETTKAAKYTIYKEDIRTEDDENKKDKDTYSIKIEYEFTPIDDVNAHKDTYTIEIPII